MRKTALLILALFVAAFAAGNRGLGMGWNTPEMAGGNARLLQGRDTSYFAILSHTNIFTGGLQTITGTTVNDGPTYGDELLTTGGWTVGANWTEAPDDVFTHTVAATATLSHSATVVADSQYQIAWTMSAAPAGVCTVSIGGQQYDMMTTWLVTWGPTATSTVAFTITPSAAFDGTISLMSLRRITAPSTPLVALRSSADTTAIEIRGSQDYSAALGRKLSTFMGRNSGQYNTSGFFNSGYGQNTFQYNTSGFLNTAMGHDAMQYNTVGGFNAAYGAYALNKNISGNTNAAFGNRDRRRTLRNAGTTLAGATGLDEA